MFGDMLPREIEKRNDVISNLKNILCLNSKIIMIVISYLFLLRDSEYCYYPPPHTKIRNWRHLKLLTISLLRFYLLQAPPPQKKNKFYGSRIVYLSFCNKTIELLNNNFVIVGNVNVHY